MLSLGELVVTSIKALAPVFFILFIGVYMVKLKLVTPVGVKAITTLITWILTPSLLFIRLGGLLSVELLQDTWPLMVAGAVLIVINGLMAYLVLVPLGKPTATFQPWYVIGLTFPNFVAIPLVFVSTICSQNIIALPERYATARNLTTDECIIMDPGECTNLGELYVFVFVVVPTITLLSLGTFYKQPPQDAEGVSKRTDHDGEQQDHHSSDLEDSDVVEASEGNQIAIEDNTKPPEPISTIYSVADAQSTAEDTSIELEPKPNADEIAKALAIHAETEDEAKAGQMKRSLLFLRTVLLQPMVLAQCLGLIVGLTLPVQEFLFDPDSFITPFMQVPNILAPASVPLVNLALAANLGIKLFKTPYKSFFGGEEEVVGASRKTILIFVLGRMILLPAISVLVTYAFQDSLPDDQLLLLIVYFECCMPSANFCVILATFANRDNEAETLSLGMVHEYILGIITLPMWCFVALYFTQRENC
mmetsp:Transcript_7511/g.13773  ORF Transcript_7511/g.13773 Transcript_7511/m.13773 type:complete len:477 (+) Transcript_7511:313-1743(+)